MAKAFKEYVDSEKKVTLGTLIHVRITPEMAERVQHLCQLNGWKPSYVVRGGIKKFLDDCSPSSKEQSFQFKKPVLDEANKSSWK